MNNPSRTTSPYYSLANIERLLQIDRITLIKVAQRSGTYYHPCDIKEIKENGIEKWRHIANPNKELKKIQTKIYTTILKRHMLLLPDGIIGGIAGKSVKDNAQPHLQQAMVYTIDIKNCFPKTTHKMVFKAWRETIDCSDEIARLFTQLTTFQRQLPQGAPTSSALCNLCLLPLFNDIKKYAQVNDISFTLYVDDITLSGDTQRVESAIPFVIRKIQKYGYAVSNRKIRRMPAHKTQKVTGIIVNKKTNIAHNTIENIRFTIRQLGRRKKGITTTEYASIIGKIQFVKNFSEKKGEKLEELAGMLLPRTVSIIKNKAKPITRKCRHHKRYINSD